MGMIQEFKKFAVKGNVVDMAIGIIIGAAFGKIVASLVGDIVMPVLGVFIGGVDFSELVLSIPALRDGSAPVAVPVGKFLQTVFDFIVIAWAVFFIVKAMNRLQKKEDEKPAAPAPPPKQEILLEEIRDLLKKNA